MPYSAVRDKQNQLIRKARDLSVFIAPESSDPIEDLTTGAGADLATLPTGYEDLGFTSTEGVSVSRETESSQVRSFGSTEPTREDVTNDTVTLTVTAQETKLLTIGLFTGVDITNLRAAAVTGELSIEKPNLPNPRYYRLLALAVDESSYGEIYLGQFMPRARITDFGEQSYGEGDDPISYPLTLTAFRASDLGYSHRWIFGGPGWLAMLADMGITQATS
ncbi:hypothetical protein ABT336_13315 [Micromonospora sp. NPDC000207]|uniref:phage tail tube protein n=1 Tax=Micromonospora sp. NPDC000207 TaxID=3154246 RepID=UPI003324E4F0